MRRHAKGLRSRAKPRETTAKLRETARETAAKLCETVAKLRVAPTPAQSTACTSYQARHDLRDSNVSTIGVSATAGQKLPRVAAVGGGSRTRKGDPKQGP